MTRLLRAAVAVVLAVAGLLALGPGPVLAGAPTDSLGTPVVTCGSYQGQPVFALSETFTHAPPALELRVYQFVGADAVDSAHAWYRPPGTDTFDAVFSAAQPSTFVVHLAKLDERTKTFVDVVDPVTTSSYSCP